MSSPRDFDEEIIIIKTLIKDRCYEEAIKKIKGKLRLPASEPYICDVPRQLLFRTKELMKGVPDFQMQIVKNLESLQDLNLQNADLYTLRAECYNHLKQTDLAFNDKRSAFHLRNDLVMRSLKDLTTFAVFKFIKEGIIEIESPKKTPAQQESMEMTDEFAVMTAHNLTREVFKTEKNPVNTVTFPKSTKRKLNFDSVERDDIEESVDRKSKKSRLEPS